MRDAFFLDLNDKDLLEKLCYVFKKKVPSLAEIMAEAEGIESSRMSASQPNEPTVVELSTYKKNMHVEQRRPAEQQRTNSGVQ